MVVPTSCPPDERWEDLLAGESAEIDQAAFTEHLETCTRCQARVEDLVAGREAWRGVAHHLTAPQPEHRPLLDQVLQKLKSGERRLDTASEPITFDDLALHFLTPSDQPGKLGRLGPYEVVELLGRGGMGVVLKAWDAELERFVALKVLAPQLATSEAARKRFAREARAAAAICHENVVAIHSVEETNGLPYLVMQYIPGTSLQDRLNRGELLGIEEILAIGVKVVHGLAAAHAQGLIHRDIKPSNILLQSEDDRPSDYLAVKITDFGLARAVDDATLTQSGLLAGTPQYMAPEQARGEPLDHRADLFSLGSVLYALCTGQPPFQAENTMAVLRLVSDGRPVPIQELRHDIPDGLVAIIDKLHARSRDERFQSASEVAELLEDYLHHLRQPDEISLPLMAASLIARAKKEGSLMALIPCSECGKQISDTAVACPHCGAQRRQVGYEYRTQATLLGVPWVHIAFGVDPATGRRRVAKAWVFALGDVAVGGVAIGGASLGVVSIGGCAVGMISLGGLALGMLAALGGLALGGLALGGLALGICAIGGLAIGWVAAYGGGALASQYAVGGLALAEHANDEAAHRFVKTFLIFSTPGQLLLEYWQVLAVVIGFCALVAIVLKSAQRRSSVSLGR